MKLSMINEESRKCIGCKKPIPPERIEALPDVKYCVKCAEDLAPDNTKADFRYSSDGTRPRHW